METGMKYILYKEEELQHGGCLDADFCRLLEELRQRHVAVISVRQTKTRKKSTQTFLFSMEKHGVLPEAALAVAATDETLAELAGSPVAVLGYRNPSFLSEELYRADYVAEGFAEIDAAFLERIYQRRHGIPWRVIETERCYLREMELADLRDLYALYDDAEMANYMEPLYEWEQEVEYTKAYIQNMYRFYGYGIWLVKDRMTDELIGRAGFGHAERDGECVLEMGYAIAAGHRRRGYAKEVCSALVDYARKADLGFDRLYCFVQKDNIASLSLLGKLAFVSDGEERRGEKNLLRYYCRL